MIPFFAKLEKDVRKDCIYNLSILVLHIHGSNMFLMLYKLFLASSGHN